MRIAPPREDILRDFLRFCGTLSPVWVSNLPAGFAAEGYAKIKRLPGLSIVTSGPGATNLVTPVANCFW